MDKEGAGFCDKITEGKKKLCYYKTTTKENKDIKNKTKRYRRIYHEL